MTIAYDRCICTSAQTDSAPVGTLPLGLPARDGLPNATPRRTLPRKSANWSAARFVRQASRPAGSWRGRVCVAAGGSLWATDWDRAGNGSLAVAHRVPVETRYLRSLPAAVCSCRCCRRGVLPVGGRICQSPRPDVRDDAPRKRLCYGPCRRKSRAPVSVGFQLVRRSAYCMPLSCALIPMPGVSFVGVGEPLRPTWGAGVAGNC